MYCSTCGTELADDAAFCVKCGRQLAPQANPPSTSPQPVSPASPSPAQAPYNQPTHGQPTYAPPVQQPLEQPAQHNWQAARPAVAYAGFWLRLFAFIIDSIILGIVVGIGVFRPLLGNNLQSIYGDNFWTMYTSMTRPFVALQLLQLMVNWLYWAGLESSSWQATLGKKALGLKVTDLAGNRVTFARASGRFFGKLISGMTLMIGFAMAGFTERKQALHDILAGCLVLRKL
jgi:uncharacterized RDD family membrane protein YckC